MDGHGPLCSFVDRDMLMRHFGHGVGHLKYERQQEMGPKRVPVGDDNHDSNDSDDQEGDDSDADEPSPEGDPLGNEDDSHSSDGESEDIEVGDSGSECNSESDDGGYASL